ncbi:hypothetical protein [Streptomyces tendae]|uniref:hypothetical protein n=1 Tax=Streptomyces tendae TaxID=1932 RepID=UPI0033F6C7C8
MPQPTDEQRAKAIRTFYGLDGNQSIVAPGYLASESAPKDATDLEKRTRQRLHDLAKGISRYTAGPEEEAALREADLPLKQHENGKWCIDKAGANSEAEFKAFLRDRGKAYDIRTFYGLDGNQPIVAPGYLASRSAPKDATDLEKRTRQRLHDLTKGISRCTAGPEEEAALREADLPLKQHDNGKWCIDKAGANSEADFKAALRDRGNAYDIRTFYGLDGNQPIVDPGYLPSGRAPQDATEFVSRTWGRLGYLSAGSIGNSAGPEEAAALREARLPLKQLDNGRWRIDKGALNRQQAQQNPANMYDSGAAQGASSQVAALSQGMEQMSVTVSADASLPAADWLAWNNTAAQESAHGVSDFSDGGGYPTNPVTAGSYLASNYGYSHEGQSSYAGSSPYAERPPSRAGRPSKRGRM